MTFKFGSSGLAAGLGLWVLAAGATSGGIGCAPSYDESTIKTAADRLREQEEQAYRDEQERRARPAETGSLEDPDAPGAFDRNQAELELQRATRSAETCPEVVTEHKMSLGKTSVTITFAKDGSVEEVTVPSPYEETRMGNCVLNAFRGLFVPPYAGNTEVITWDVDLSPKKSK